MNIRSRKLWMGTLLVAAVGATSAYYVYTRTGDGSAATDEATHSHDAYYCPMHPQQRSDHPGNCPICSMKLVELEKTPAAATSGAAGGGTPDMAGMATDSSSASPATPGGSAEIFIAPERRQLIGIKSVPAEVRNLARDIRTVGRIAYDETKITHIHTKVAGFIEDVFVDYVGRPVKRGEPLFTIYSPELVATQEEYLLALRSNSTLGDSAFPWISKGSTNLLEAARRRLLLWDVTAEEIAALEKEGKAKRELTVYSPVSGIVTERAAYHHGRQVAPEMDLYTIVDLSTVWILGEVYEYELPFLKVGQSAKIEFPYNAGVQQRTGTISFISPTLNPKTRTAEVRMEFGNPDFTLRPDTFLNFALTVNLGRQISIPIDAVLHSGTNQYVFIDKGNGYFEPRPVKTGPQAGDYVAIENGIRNGEMVVTAANFILDSESRLKGAFDAMGAPSRVQASPSGGGGTQNLSVEIVEPKTAKVGANNIRLALKDPSGKPIEAADVEVTLFMPQMGNMAPMTSKANLKDSGNGTYAGSINFPMAWTWDTTVNVKKGGQPVGSAKTTITAR